jgi:hypothetical protein
MGCFDTGKLLESGNRNGSVIAIFSEFQKIDGHSPHEGHSSNDCRLDTLIKVHSMTAFLVNITRIIISSVTNI